MKCANCGAELKVGCIYCSVCGHEAQIVPDYSVLEDDWLRSMIEDEKAKQSPSEKKPSGSKLKPKPVKKKPKKKSQTPLIVGFVVLCLVVGLGIFLGVRSYRNNSFDYQYTQGLLKKQTKDYTAAVEYLNRALELEEDSTDVMFELAEIYQVKKNEKQLERILLRIVKQDSDNRTAYEMLIQLYDSQKKYNAILKLYEEKKDTSLAGLFDPYLVSEPQFSLASGSYDEDQELRLTAEEDCTVYYTLDGSDPLTNGKIYTQPLKLTEGETFILAAAKDSRGLTSEVAEAEYEISYPAPDVPSVLPPSGTYVEPQTIRVLIPPDCNVYYTWDGTVPTAESLRYDAPLEMPEGNNIFSLIAINSRGLTSRVVKYNYIYQPQ